MKKKCKTYFEWMYYIRHNNYSTLDAEIINKKEENEKNI